MEFDHFTRFITLRQVAHEKQPTITSQDGLTRVLLPLFRPCSTKKTGHFDKLVAHIDFCLEALKLIFDNLSLSVDDFSDQTADRLVWFRLAIEMIANVATQIKKGR